MNIYRACFVFCGGRFEFLIRGLLVLSLEPKLRKSGTGGKIRKFSEAADRSTRIIILLELRAISVISVPDLALADHAQIQNSKWPPKDKVRRLIFHSYSKWM